jgi:peptidoglycan/LPS O-acetylase OafA/YrhL
MSTAEVTQSSEAIATPVEISHAHATTYRPDIDGLRAVAALAVVAAHAGWLHGGGFGVDIFFVISGYLISGIIFRSLRQGEFSFLDFYARRVKRIFPALIVLLTSVSVLGWLLLPAADQARLSEDIVAGAAFVQNLWLYASIEGRYALPRSILSHLWTLGIEEQFYLFWPLLLAATWLLLRKWRLRSMLATVVLSLASYAWALSSDLPQWLLPWNRLWELASGAVLAYLQFEPGSGTPPAWMALFRRPSIRGLPGMLGVICATVGLLGLDDKWPSGYAWVPVLGAFLMIAAGPRHWFNRHVLAARPVVLIGLISYPLYLWHWSLFTLAAILDGHASTTEVRQLPLLWKVGVVLASLVLSYLTYRYVERPLRSSRNTRGVALLLCVAMVVCASLAYSLLG